MTKELPRAVLIKALINYGQVLWSSVNVVNYHCNICNATSYMDKEDRHLDASWHAEDCIMRDVIEEWKSKYAVLE